MITFDAELGVSPVFQNDDHENASGQENPGDSNHDVDLEVTTTTRTSLVTDMNNVIILKTNKQTRKQQHLLQCCRPEGADLEQTEAKKIIL